MQFKKIAVVALPLVLVAGSAFAALPTEVDTAITAVTTDGTAMVTKGYALTAAITGALILLGLFAKVLKRSAR